MPRGDGDDGCCGLQGLVATADIDTAVPRAEGTQEPLAVALVLRSGNLLVEVAQVGYPRDMAFAGYGGGSGQGESGEGGTENEVEMLPGDALSDAVGELAVAPVGEERPKRLECPVERVAVDAPIMNGVGMLEGKCVFDLLGIDGDVVSHIIEKIT